MSSHKSSQQQNIDHPVSDEYREDIIPTERTLVDLVSTNPQQLLYLDQNNSQPSNTSSTPPQDHINLHQSANMMSYRDMGYGYMPQAVPSYSAAQAYQSSIAAMSTCYPDLSKHLSASQNSIYVPHSGYSRYSIPQQDREHVIRRRRRNSTERRHQMKLISRKPNLMQPTNISQTSSITASRIPSVVETGLEESSIQTSSADMYTTQESLQISVYSTEGFQRANSYEPSNSLQDSYRATPLGPTYDITQQSISSPPLYSTNYTMASIKSPISSLIPPTMMPSQPSHNTYPIIGRPSPLLLTPLPPQGMISPRLEPVMMDTRRDKPQCWDHGCNGREFSTFSNLLRHQREKSGSAAKSYCPRCSAEFTRTTARNGHMEHGKCKSRRTSGVGVLGRGNQADS